MKRIALLTCALLAFTSHAAEPIKPSTRQLTSLCDGCRIVTAVNTEKRKGQASGVGAAGGAVAGGVVGSKVGDSTMATVGGAVVGGVLGHQIERQLKRHTVWVVSSVDKDGATQKTEFGQDPGLKTGDTVVVEGGGLKRR